MSRLLVVLVVLIAAAGFTESVRAATYDVYVCGDAPDRTNNSWTLTNNTPDKLTGNEDCAGGGSFAGLSVRDVMGVSNSPAGAFAAWEFAAPSGTAIAAFSYQRWLYKDADDDWAPRVFIDTSDVETCHIVYPATDCAVGVGGTRATFGSLSASKLGIGVSCRASAPSTCGNGGTYNGVAAVLYGATVTLSDPSSPTVSNVGGSLFDPGYARGTRGVSFDASDNSGIRGSRVLVDGVGLPVTDFPCDFTYTVPCSNKTGAQLSVDTRSLSDGSHLIEVAARDAASNETRSSGTTVVVDNSAPASPQGLAVEGGSTWRPSNSFSLTWTNPSNQVSPIASALVSICAADATACSTPQRFDGAGISRVDGLSVPSTGEWLARVWLQDSAGNVDPSSASATTLRYGTPPADPSPSPGGATAPATDTRADSIGAPDQSLDTPTGTDPVLLQPPVLADPALRITSVRYSHGRLTLRGRTAAGASGTLSLRIRRGKRLFTLRQQITGGAFRVTALAAKPRTPLKLSFAGNSFFTAQRVTTRVR